MARYISSSRTSFSRTPTLARCYCSQVTHKHITCKHKNTFGAWFNSKSEQYFGYKESVEEMIRIMSSEERTIEGS